MVKKEVRIDLEGVSKRFVLDFKKDESFLAKISRLISKGREERVIEVFNNISLKAVEGEVIGIIGKNGSGKTTLLKLIARMYAPSAGEVKINGKVAYISGSSPFINLKRTMRENIYILGSKMGLDKKEIKDKFEDIVEFSGLKNFVDVRIYQFSSGMIARLYFSTIIHLMQAQDSDIILLDELFRGEGDLSFQKKAAEKIKEITQGKATIVIVSHSLEDIKHYCDRALLLERGEIIKEGKPRETLNYYKK